MPIKNFEKNKNRIIRKTESQNQRQNEFKTIHCIFWGWQRWKQNRRGKAGMLESRTPYIIILFIQSKMPKPLEEYFPKKKTVKILVRQHDKTLKLRKMQRKVAKLQSKLVKPKYSLR